MGTHVSSTSLILKISTFLVKALDGILLFVEIKTKCWIVWLKTTPGSPILRSELLFPGTLSLSFHSLWKALSPNPPGKLPFTLKKKKKKEIHQDKLSTPWDPFLHSLTENLSFQVGIFVIRYSVSFQWCPEPGLRFSLPCPRNVFQALPWSACPNTHSVLGDCWQFESSIYVPASSGQG